jgi:flagellar basal body-associated protein FliL
MKKIMIIIIAAVILAGSAAVYFLVIRGRGGEKEVELTSFVPGDYFVTNLAGSSSLFKVSTVLMLNTDKLSEELEAKKYIIRDTIIARLRKLTEEDFASEGIQDRLRSDLTEELNSVLGIDNIVTIYFGDFVMQ